MVQAALIVDAHPTQLATTAQLLTYAGYSVTAVSTFEEARARLSTIQDLSLLVADVRLGQYNGLHLALRARALHPNVRVIITDRTFDAALQSEAERIGVAYAAKPLTSQQLADLLARLSAASQPASSRVRRWPRKHVADRIPAEVGARPARLVDISYGGVCIEFPQPDFGAALPPTMRVVLPESSMAFNIHPVWAKPAPDAWVCGGEIIQSDTPFREQWRHFVDACTSPM